ncbi:MAG: SUF system NifU family Fe-S cluster assembly protein [Patescibacteria group bacterium]|nr:SUF system NifU family Fe-S cluster assembly protein [Patescibacteria group bacterium]
MDLYRQKILDHYRAPRNFGKLKGATHKAQRGNPLCGDEVEIALKITRGVVRQVKFTGTGCAISMAATSLLTEAVSGQRLSQVRRLTEAQALRLLGTPIGPARHKCALLGYEALQKALGK